MKTCNAIITQLSRLVEMTKMTILIGGGGGGGSTISIQRTAGNIMERGRPNG